MWHKECFLCSGCRTPLANQPFTSQEESPFCITCFSNLHAKKCSGCHAPITGGCGQSGCLFEPDPVQVSWASAEPESVQVFWASPNLCGVFVLQGSQTGSTCRSRSASGTCPASNARAAPCLCWVLGSSPTETRFCARTATLRKRRRRTEEEQSHRFQDFFRLRLDYF